MKEKHFQKWQSTRVKGKSRFILINGLIGWGLPMFIIMTFVVNKPEAGHMSPSLVALNAFIWAIGGLAFGYFVWSASERVFQKELKSREKA